MIIKKCSNCGNMINVGRFYGSTCIFCNSYVSLEEPHKNVDKAVTLCEKYLSEAKDETVSLCDIYIERFPYVSMLYWCRLLGKNRCRNEIQLLETGIRFIDDEDYIAAYDCADNNERAYYSTLVQIYYNLQKTLLFKTEKKKKETIFYTGIKQKQEAIYQELQTLSEEFRKMTDNLSSIEMQMKNHVTDCEIYYEFWRAVVDKTYEDVSKLHFDIRSKNEISDKKKYEYQSIIEKNLKKSEYAYKKAEEFTTTKMYDNCCALIKKRNIQEKNILALTNRINELDKEMKDIINKVTDIYEKFENAVDQAKKKDYEAIKAILGDSEIKAQLNYMLCHK